MAIITLNEIDAALSFRPIFFTCEKKNSTTSNKGIPRKPGIINCLLFRIKKAIGLVVTINRSNLFNFLSFAFLPYKYPMLFGIL